MLSINSNTRKVKLMRWLISLLLLVLLGVFIACTPTATPDAAATPITTFAQCVAAGNPVMESYPAQCKAGDEVFVQNIDEPLNDYEQPIGGQRDNQSCLGPAGCSWDETVGACTRNWELNQIQQEGARVAAAAFTQPVTILDVTTKPCEGCYVVTLQRNNDAKTFTVNIVNNEVSWIANEITGLQETNNS